MEKSWKLIGQKVRESHLRPQTEDKLNFSYVSNILLSIPYLNILSNVY